MDYEKAYNKALEMAKHALDSHKAGVVKTDKVLIESMFPELKESKEEWIEKIRQELKSYLEHREVKQISESDAIHQWIAWLEKQGEKKPIEMKSPEESLGVSSKEYNEIVNECLYGDSKSADKVEPKFKVGDWVVTSYGKVNQVIAVDKDGDGFTLDDGTYFSGSWKDNYHLWTIQDAKDGDVLVDDLGNICIYKESSLNSMYYSYCYGNHKYFVDGGGSHVIVDTCPASKEQRNILFQKMKEEGYEWDTEKKELKKIDTVQPKFKVGDWILYSGDHYEGVRHITKIDENGYYIERNGFPHGIIPFNHEICMRPWTIQDAKDGDVLAESKNDVILMFRGIGNTEWDDVIDYHCYYDCYRKDFIVQKGVEYWGNIENNQLKPATKEQRDLLFSKMKEAGYEWNAEKKELKKIDTPQPKFKVGDWIANDYCYGKVIALTDDAYLLDSGQGIPFSCEHNAHLWTIRDAKDGDVIAFSNDTIVMFKNLYNSTTFHSYCHIEDGVFNISKDDMPDWWEGKGFYPATKEQRDLLFQKMKEEGYEWDAEKKELKKIEDEPENYKNN